MNVLWRHVRRAYSTSLPVFPQPTPQLNRVDKHIQLLSQQSQNPIWELLAALNGRPAYLPAALRRCSISPEEYNRWKPVLAQVCLDSGMDVAKENMKSAGLKDNAEHIFQSLPPWVALFLTSFKTRTYRQAYVTSRALRPATFFAPYRDGPTNDDELQKYPTNSPIAAVAPDKHHEYGALLTLTALHLSRYNLLVPLRDLVKTFLSPEYQFSPLQFNLLLDALSTVPSYSLEIEARTLSVLRTMEQRGFEVSPKTLRKLLHVDIAGPTLTKYLDRQISQRHVEGHLEDREKLLGVSSKHAAEGRLPIEFVQQQHEAIKDLVSQPQADNPNPPAPQSQPVGYMKDPLNRANMHYIMSYTRRKDALALFDRLLSSTNKQGSEYRADIFAYTSALKIAARDHMVSAQDLVQAFRHIPKSMTPTSTTYHIVITGLFERKSPLASKLWDEFCRSGLPVNKYMLSLGLRVLTREGKPHASFAFLETFARPSGERLSQEPVKITAVTVNDFLVALNRIGRPDLIYLLFDNMWTLFHILPDAKSLAILQYGARIMRRLDNSLAGVVAELSLKNPFRSSRPSPQSTTSMARQEAAKAVESVVGTPGTGKKPYKPRIWHNETAVHRAITIFQQAMFGNDPELLRHVRSPAYAVRASPDEDPAAGYGGLLPKFGRLIDPTMGASALDALLNKDGTTRYPSIMITNENVISGIILLGLSSRATEIPLILAWMKALKIQPSPSTFAVSLVFWEEVSFEAPLMEKLSGEENNQYTKLWNWMRDWVGEKRMPNPLLMQKWQENVRKMRAT